jgi:hypothetical protein
MFHLVIDVWGFRLWSTPFIWIGMNAISVYMLVELGLIGRVAERLVGGGRYSHDVFGDQGRVTLVVSMVLTFAVARFLYARNVFIRV